MLLAALIPLLLSSATQGSVAKTQAPTNIRAINALWGFADLHCHPASHLAFGFDGTNNGIFYGKPGLALANANSTLPSDLAPCAADSHSGFDLDPVRKGTRSTIIQTLDASTAYEHGPSGWPDFRDWPNAMSVDHQQMHIVEIRRAYEGGLRLMVAAAVENQMLSDLWHIGFNLFGNSVPKPDSNIEFQSAQRQLQFIREMAAANSSWMQIVTTSAECKQAIQANKLAVVLSVEMDSLNPAQILTLANTLGVREVIPIHLSNNSFGGTAAYSDLFNTNTQFLTGSFIQVVDDPLVAFRFSRPSTLQVPGGSFGSWFEGLIGAIGPGSVSDSVFNALGYQGGNGGHRNRLGLNEGELQELMKAGLIIDVAHMSQVATDAALSLAERFHYPVIDSHTGIRPAVGIADNERDLLVSHAQRIGALGGMLGLGTTGDQANVSLLNISGDAANPLLVRFTGSVHDFTRVLSATGPHTSDPTFRVTVTIFTGGDDLRGGSHPGDNANITLFLRNGNTVVRDNANNGQDWGNNSAHAIIMPVPAGTLISDIVRINIHTGFGGGLSGDNWNVNQLQVNAVSLKNDMVQTFISSYGQALTLLHGRVGLGTDFNGLSPQIPFASQEVPYPFVPPTAPAGTPALAASKLGNRTFSFQRDGIAHYGMLADFMEAISKRPASSQVVNGLFSSANAFFDMWQATEAAAKTVH